MFSDDFCAGLSGKIAKMLGYGNDAAIFSVCSRGLHRCIWRTLEPLGSELVSRKSRRAARAAQTAAVDARQCAVQAALYPQLISTSVQAKVRQSLVVTTRKGCADGSSEFNACAGCALLHFAFELCADSRSSS
jgi:hypothetical protein